VERFFVGKKNILPIISVFFNASMITVYTKDYCPYCVQAKNLLSSLGVTFTEVDLTDDPDRFIEIAQKSRMRTVPQIFV